MDLSDQKQNLENQIGIQYISDGRRFTINFWTQTNCI